MAGIDAVELMKFTNDGMRELFFGRGLSYAQITRNDITALEGYLALEYAAHERAGNHMELHPSTDEFGQTEVEPFEDGEGIQAAFIFVDGYYFSRREAISFNGDGFIGFAGWASDVNAQPFLRAFYRWVTEWMEAKGGERDGR